MLRENRLRTWEEHPTSPETQVGTAKRKVGVSKGCGTSDRLIVLGGRESRLQEATNITNSGEGVDDRS